MPSSNATDPVKILDSNDFAGISNAQKNNILLFGPILHVKFNSNSLASGNTFHRLNLI